MSHKPSAGKCDAANLKENDVAPFTNFTDESNFFTTPLDDVHDTTGSQVTSHSNIKNLRPGSGDGGKSFATSTLNHSGMAGSGGGQIIHFLNFITLPSTTAT